MAVQQKFSTPIHIANDVYIRPTYFVIRPQFEGVTFKRSLKQKENEKNLKDNSHKSQLSTKAISNLRNSINWLVHSAKYKRVWSKRDNKAFWFKVNFITLTIPPQKNEVINEKDFQKCLNIWLVYARKYFYLHNYVWKVEAHEDKRLHIHLTTDTFINYKLLRNAWNRILQSKGLLDEHFNKFGNYDPNSTDIHAIHKVNKVAAYMCEYMTKKPNLPVNFKGRIWSCSYSLSPKNKCHCELEPQYDKINYSFVNNSCIRYKAIESKPDALGNTRKISDMYLLSEYDWQMNMDGLIKDAYNSHRNKIRLNTPQSPQSYRQIDFLSFKNIEEYEKQSEKTVILSPCEISPTIPKIGLTQLDLQF